MSNYNHSLEAFVFTIAAIMSVIWRRFESYQQGPPIWARGGMLGSTNLQASSRIGSFRLSEATMVGTAWTCHPPQYDPEWITFASIFVWSQLYHLKNFILKVWIVRGGNSENQMESTHTSLVEALQALKALLLSILFSAISMACSKVHFTLLLWMGRLMMTFLASWT